MERLELEVLEDSIRVMEAMEKFCGFDNFEKLKLEFLKELKGYRILQEQGRLMELPCAEGDTVYSLDSYCNGLDSDCPSRPCEECAYYQLEIFEENFRLDMIVDFGETVFLTHEEAEEALKRMVDGNE